VAYVGVCATDLEILEGRLGYYKSGLAKYPIVPGHEFSGTVAAVGSRVTDVREGDRVVVECIQGCGFCAACRRRNPIGCDERSEVGVIGRDGGYAEYMVTPERFLHRLPDGLGLREAALCEPLAVVLKGLGRLARAWGGGDDPRVVAVVGGGPIGYLTARVLYRWGHRVTVFDRLEQRRAAFVGNSIETSANLETLARFDAVVEATGDPDALNGILHASAAGSTMLLLGLPYARREFNFEAIVGYDKTVVGSVGSNREDFDAALALLPALDLRALVERTMRLEEYAEAWRLVRSRERLKVLLRVDPAA
jgi:threonine dehydrogenase-like Zn-dependent dehydrogenase